MNQRLQIILISAFVLAAGASYVVYRLVGHQLATDTSARKISVVVAAHDLEIGTIVKAGDLVTSSIVGVPPKDTILKPETAIGRGVLSLVYAGEPLIEKRLAGAGSGGGLAATIPAGMRACAVRVDEVVGVAGFVLPGMHVDILVTGSVPGDAGAGGTRVKTLLQNIEVLSAGKNFQHDAEGKPAEATVVNLLVTPNQAEVLSLASNQTRIQLVLRNPLDQKVSAPPGSDVASLFGAPPPKQPIVAGSAAPSNRPAAIFKPARSAAPEAPPPPLVTQFHVEVINGGKATQQSFTLAGASR